MKKIILLSLICLPLFVSAQYYKNGLGVKLGMPGITGINAKFHTGKKFALDNTLAVNFGNTNRFLQAQILFEYNRRFGLNEGYNWYAGVGPNVNYYLKGGYINNDLSYQASKIFIKADGVFGLEYTAPRTRINAAVEAGPTAYLYPMVKIGAFFNVAVRYVLKR